MTDLKGLVDTKKEYITYLLDAITEPIIQEFETIYNEHARKSSRILQTFQQHIAKIPEWNHLMIAAFYQRVLEQSNCTFFPELIRAIFTTYIKIHLHTHNVADKLDKIRVKIPNSENFLHRCLIACARVVWKQPYLYYHAVRTLEQQHNRLQLEELFQKAIHSTIRACIPMDQILSVSQSSGGYQARSEPMSENEEDDVETESSASEESEESEESEASEASDESEESEASEASDESEESDASDASDESAASDAPDDETHNASKEDSDEEEEKGNVATYATEQLATDPAPLDEGQVTGDSDTEVVEEIAKEELEEPLKPVEPVMLSIGNAIAGESLQGLETFDDSSANEDEVTVIHEDEQASNNMQEIQEVQEIHDIDLDRPNKALAMRNESNVRLEKVQIQEEASGSPRKNLGGLEARRVVPFRTMLINKHKFHKPKMYQERTKVTDAFF